MIKKYLLIFVTTFVGYTFINWFASLHFDLNINKNYVDFWVPAVICYVLTYFIFRPFLKKLNYKKKATDFLLWCLIPFTIWIPIAFSQGYFKDISYKVITVNKPKDLDKYPKERFFKITNFVVDTSKHFLIKERHTSGKYGSTLNLNRYFVIPMFDDTIQKNDNQISKVGYGVKFNKSLNNGLLFKDGQDEKVAAFRQKSKEDFSKYNFYKVDYFEKIKNTDDSKYLLEAESYNSSFDKTADNIVLMNRSGSIQDLYKRGEKMFLYSTLICLGLGLTTLYFVNRYQLKAQQPT